MRLLLLLAACAPDSFGASAVEVSVLPQADTIQGRDGGPSGLAWGHSVWTFGDTVLNLADEIGTNWHHNSFSITDDLDGSDGIGGFSERTDSAGAPRYFIAPTADEAAFNADHYGDSCKVAPCGARWAVWPGRPVWDGTRALVFYGLIYAEPGDFNFHGVGQSVAVWDNFSTEPARPSPSPGTAHPTLLFGEDEPAWGTAALIDQQLLYVFACDSDGNGFAPPCYLAQVEPDRVLDRAAWRYWNGGAFVASMDGKQSLFDGAPSISVAWNQHLQAYTVIYAQPLSNRVVIRTAPSLTGPWTEARLLFEANKEPEGAYDANWHAEYDAGKLLYVTYSRSNHMGWFGSEFALVRVTLP
jgi:Domain of unknown function (DUF4185)